MTVRGLRLALLLVFLGPYVRAQEQVAEKHAPSPMFDSVVGVWSEYGHETGFIVDQKSLILTNERVIGASEIISVQFDPQHKVRATLLAADKETDKML